MSQLGFLETPMKRQKQLLGALVVLIAVGGFLAIGPVHGQILAEQTYYEETYENDTHIDLEEYELEEFDSQAALGTRSSDRIRVFEGGDTNDYLWQSGTSGRTYDTAILPDSKDHIKGTRSPHVGRYMEEADVRLWRTSDTLSSRVGAVETTDNETIVANSRNSGVTKFDEEGDVIWYNDNIDSDVDFSISNQYGLEIMPNRNIIVGGQGGTFKLDSDDGEVIWALENNDPTGDMDEQTYGITAHPDGETIYVTQHVGDGIIVELNNEGEVVEEHDLPIDDQIRDVAIGPHGHIYVADDSTAGVTKFNQNFDMIWRNTNPSGISSWGSALAVHASGDVFLAESSSGTMYKIDGETGETIWSRGIGSTGYGASVQYEVNHAFGYPNFNDHPPVVDAADVPDLDETYSGEVYYPSLYTSLEEESLSVANEITKEWEEEAITEDGVRNVYVIINAEAGTEGINAEVEQFGEAQATDSVSANSRGEMVLEFEPQTHELEVTVESDTPFEIMDFRLVTLEETTEGDPLAVEEKPAGMTLDPDTGYDRTVGVFISGLDITTDMLLYIIMIALIVGFIVFSYTKSVRGQEFAQSMLFGAIIAGIVIVGLVPTLNAATWVFTGDIDRAPLANPALEAEPPTYYSTEFQAGTMDGWEHAADRTPGTALVEQAGEDSFDIQFQGTDEDAAIIRHDKHIALGNALDTGFVEVGGVAEGQAGLGEDGDPHEVQVNMRVYVTEDGNLDENDLLDPDTNYVLDEDVEQEIENRDQLAAVEEVASSFDGEVVRQQQMATFPLEGEYIHTRVVVHDNRNDVTAVGGLSDARVGATTEGGSVDH